MPIHLLQGNEAIALGALKAGLSFFAGYPITPASEIMHFLAKEAVKNPKLKFIHFEGEIGSINAVMGASLAGALAMTATSGPGFSLMQETIGFGQMAEIPCVIVNVMRVGPSTGMPTIASQGDIMQSRYGSHGDYYPLVFYPNSVAECYRYTIEAFNAAEESLSPVILLTDGFIAHLYETVDLEKIEIPLKRRNRAPLGQGKRHFTGLLSNEKGLPCTDNFQVYRKWNQKVKERNQKVAEKYNFFEYFENKKSDTLLISLGIVSRVVQELKNRFALFRPIRLFPMLEKELLKIAGRYQKIAVIEMNDGQYGEQVERVLKREVKKIPLLGGRVSFSEIKKLLQNR